MSDLNKEHYNAYMEKYYKLKSKLRGVAIKYIAGQRIVYKDGNKVGRNKKFKLLHIYYDVIRMKSNVNAHYGAYTK